MPFCRKCGVGITAADVFCPKCGAKNNFEKIEKVKTAAPASVPSGTPAPESKEDGIALAGQLADTYAEIEKLKQEINAEEVIIKTPVPEPKSHSFFKYFWPALIIAPIILSVFYYIGTVVGTINQMVAPVFILYFIGFVGAAATLGIGAAISKNKQNKFNTAEQNRAHQMHVKIDQSKKKIGELSGLVRSKHSTIKQYENFIPAECRTSNSMNRVKAFLESGRAETFTDALKM